MAGSFAAQPYQSVTGRHTQIQNDRVVGRTGERLFGLVDAPHAVPAKSVPSYAVGNELRQTAVVLYDQDAHEISTGSEAPYGLARQHPKTRSEEHTSALQSLMRI